MGPPLQPPVPPRFLPGRPPATTPDEFNAKVRDPFTFLLDTPRFRARRVGALTVAENATNYIAWDTIDEDNYGGWNATTPGRYTAQAPGWYLVTGAVSLSGTGAAGLVVIPGIAVNGTSHTGVGGVWEGPEVFVPTGAASQPKIVSGTWTVYCEVGDFLQLNLFYSTESAITAVDTTAGLQCRIEITWDGV